MTRSYKPDEKARAVLAWFKAHPGWQRVGYGDGELCCSWSWSTGKPIGGITIGLGLSGPISDSAVRLRIKRLTDAGLLERRQVGQRWEHRWPEPGAPRVPCPHCGGTGEVAS